MYVFPALFSSTASATFFFFTDTATTEIYTLSLHDALPICRDSHRLCCWPLCIGIRPGLADSRRLSRHRFRKSRRESARPDRKSTRLNSSHVRISYAVFCLKKKNKTTESVHKPTPEKGCSDC